MSLFIDLVETFELPYLTHRTYNAKIEGLLNSFPRLEGNNKFRTVLPHKYPKTADDYVSMKLCIIGRVPVYGIYNRRDLKLIAVCVQGTLFAIDDCDLNPHLVPDLRFQRVRLNVKHSVRQGNPLFGFITFHIYSTDMIVIPHYLIFFFLNICIVGRYGI